MIKHIVINLGKKYVVDIINDTLKKYQDNVYKITCFITLWIDRLEKIIQELKKINARISDYDLTDDEIKKSLEEIETIVKEF